jgi:hypothetical protein
MITRPASALCSPCALLLSRLLLTKVSFSFSYLLTRAQGSAGRITALPTRIAQKNELLSSLSRLQTKTQWLLGSAAPALPVPRRPDSAIANLRSPPKTPLLPHPRAVPPMDMPWSPQPKPPKRSPARRNAVPIVSIIGDEDEFFVRRRRRPPPVEEPPPPPPEKPTWLSKGARDRARAALEAELAVTTPRPSPPPSYPLPLQLPPCALSLEALPHQPPPLPGRCLTQALVSP